MLGLLASAGLSIQQPVMAGENRPSRLRNSCALFSSESARPWKAGRWRQVQRAHAVLTAGVLRGHAQAAKGGGDRTERAAQTGDARSTR